MKRELDQLQREQQAATRDLFAQAKAYPRSPEVAQASYRAGQKAEEIQRQFLGKEGDVRNKYEDDFQRQKAKLVAGYDAEITAINNGSQPSETPVPVRRALPVTPTLAAPPPSSATTPITDDFPTVYEVTGLPEGRSAQSSQRSRS